MTSIAAYFLAGASDELAGLPLTLGAEFGHERGIFDVVAGCGKWDRWVAAGLELEPFRLGLGFSRTGAGRDALFAAFFAMR